MIFYRQMNNLFWIVPLIVVLSQSFLCIKIIGYFFRIYYSFRTPGILRTILSYCAQCNKYEKYSWMRHSSVSIKEGKSLVILNFMDFFFCICYDTQFVENSIYYWQLPLTLDEFMDKLTYMNMHVCVCTRVPTQPWSLYCIEPVDILHYLQLHRCQNHRITE